MLFGKEPQQFTKANHTYQTEDCQSSIDQETIMIYKEAMCFNKHHSDAHFIIFTCFLSQWLFNGFVKIALKMKINFYICSAFKLNGK